MKLTFAGAIALIATAAEAATKAKPFGVQSHIDYTAPVTAPAKGTVWFAGKDAVVSWDQLSGSQYKNRHTWALIILGHKTQDNKWYWDVNNPLGNATLYGGPNFKTVKVPQDIDENTDYKISLQGSSSNKSPAFKIKKGLLN